MRKLIKDFIGLASDKNFIHIIEIVEVIVSKLLSLLMMIVIFATVFDLAIFVLKEIFFSEKDYLSQTLFKIFGLFLNVLIALEILENITAYLKKHVLQVELVIVTSLIAIARKIIILDLKATEGIDIIGLGIAILSLSISYLIIRSSNSRKEN
ncbi:phosphate-starvation-inducible PsiE family protein [Dolichospermum circinale]|uniref:Phosphate-starvation-inducible PsiE family protein n=1 Tax=Dolichospermum circinale CS-537/01 TaxID=3021739 RepID=A0ABT5A1H9_9CYAN|nr:phosphate-starvation-inducible PsiE family protein [Dolichospermum circinale]MDB9459782.1 phosphate-starvation-inducible PsiE family protein [Dolichospermum circinale CS-545/17]MDB9468435.1 phosphate-starvation-inducible PsiE family protein [Dolichospermum circinale CS-539/09]MDB9472952.1 phosphate-starvation-inducible PsiE family protein [Dolichospermum circinale CS-539]MDB9485777.1 phosphate-starvation-inducible PsiE family protein [Dolichospermum circinale CS-537/01]